MAVNINLLKEYLLENIITTRKKLEEDEPLFSSGLVDSFGMLDMLFFIRETYGAAVEDFEIADNCIDTLEDLQKLIEEKL